MNNNIKTPDQRLRVFVSSTLQELAAEREALQESILNLPLIPVMFELGARPYPPRDLYKAYLQQSHIFIGVYWQQYGWVAPEMRISGLEDEFQLAGNMPRLIYIKEPSPKRSPELNRLLATIGQSGVSFKQFSNLQELKELASNDLAILLTERFESSMQRHSTALEADVINEQLPFPSTSLIGREREIEEILDWIHKQHVRLVTLTGIGGIGKTRVALEVARKVKSWGKASVCFVPLAGIDRAEDIPAAILHTLFPAASTTRPPMQLLCDLLRNKQVLLILDNFEQIVNARLVVAELLSNCPLFTVVITSRERLNISSESEFKLEPLNWGAEQYDGALQPLENLAPAIRLFVQRAKAFRQDFQLDRSNYSYAVQICSALDGIPLGIELAATRVKFYSLSEICSMLEKRLDMLKGTMHDMPQRHQTLRAMIDWSYSLLPKQEQHLLCLLSVFYGGCSLEAVKFMGADDEVKNRIWEFPRDGFYLSSDIPTEEMLVENNSTESIEALLSKSLVSTTVDKFGSLRINFYQTIQQYATEELCKIKGDHKAHLHHLLYFLRLLEKTWKRLKSEDAQKAYETIDIDLDNINASLYWSVDNSPVYGLRLAIAMAEYWDTRGRFDQASHWLEKLLNIQPELKKDHFNLYCIARLELIRALFRLSNFDKASKIADECAMEARYHKNWHLLADALILQTLIMVYTDQDNDQESKIKEASELARSINYEMALLDIIQHKAADKIFHGATTEGLQLATESLELAIKLKAERWVVIANILIGYSHLFSGSLEKAESYFNSSLKKTLPFHDQLLPVYGLTGLCQVALSRQDFTHGLTILGCIQSFLERPGTSVVPIVGKLLAATLEQISQIPSAIAEPAMAAGRLLRLDEGIQLAINKGEQAGTLADV